MIAAWASDRDDKSIIFVLVLLSPAAPARADGSIGVSNMRMVATSYNRLQPCKIELRNLLKRSRRMAKSSWQNQIFT